MADRPETTVAISATLETYHQLRAENPYAVIVVGLTITPELAEARRLWEEWEEAKRSSSLTTHEGVVAAHALIREVLLDDR